MTFSNIYLKTIDILKHFNKENAYRLEDMVGLCTVLVSGYCPGWAELGSALTTRIKCNTFQEKKKAKGFSSSGASSNELPLWTHGTLNPFLKDCDVQNLITSITLLWAGKCSVLA